MDWFIPQSLSEIDTIILVISAAVTSFVSAAMGIGGGLLLLLIMANIVPVSVLIPLHGLAQLGSNANRMVMVRNAIQWPVVAYFAMGCAVGVCIAALILIQLPLAFLQLSIAVFVLLMVWGVKPKKRDLPKPLRVLAGAITGFLTMFVGATGPLVASIIYSQRVDKHQIVASFAACMTAQHSMKIIAFLLVGYSFYEYIPIILMMILAGAFGTWLGLKVLNRMNNEYFSWWFKLFLSLLALRTFYIGISSIW